MVFGVLLISLNFFRGQFKIGLCQLSVTADKARNIAHARKAVEDAAQKGAKLVVLPVSLLIVVAFASLRQLIFGTSPRNRSLIIPFLVVLYFILINWVGGCRYC